MSALEITKRLGGDWRGSYGLIPGPGHSTRDRSLKVYDKHDGNGVGVYSFAGDDWRACRAWLGLEHSREELTPEEKERAQRRRERAERRRQREVEFKQREAARIWVESRPPANSLVDTYLCGRGYQMSIPPVLRFHPSIRHSPSGIDMPAMVGLVEDAGGAVAIHRTYLDYDGRKIGGPDAKMSLGPIGAGAVRLRWPVKDTLGLAEGIENALSVMQMYALPCWSTQGARYVCDIPEHVRKIVIFADHGTAGEKAAEDGRRRYSAQGRTVEVRLPYHGDGWQGDWNDLARECC